MGNLPIGDRQRKTLVKMGNLGKVGGIFFASIRRRQGFHLR